MVPTDVHVELRGIGKRFGAIEALSGIDLTIERGRIHALVGENGAGKSTLGRLIAGVHAPDAGTMTVDGRAVSYRSPGGALADGITIIAQELSLVPQLSVVENVFLGNSIARAGIVDRRAQREKFDALCESAGFSLDPHARAGGLRGMSVAWFDPGGCVLDRAPVPGSLRVAGQRSRGIWPPWPAARTCS